MSLYPDPKHPRPKRTPPASASPYGPLEPIDLAAVDAAFTAEVCDEQALFFKWAKLFGGNNLSPEPNISFTRSLNQLYCLYYEFQRLEYNNQDAGEAALKCFLRYY